MNAIISFSWTQLKRFMRDPIYLFFVFAFPLIFLFLFGTIFGGNNDYSFKVAVLNNSQNDFSKDFVDKISKDSKVFKVDDSIKSLDAAKEKVSRGEIDSIIELPKSFGEKSSQTECEAGVSNACLPSGKMNVYYDPARAEAGTTVASIMDGVVQEMNQSITGDKTLFEVSSVSTGVEGMSQFDYTFAGLFAYTLMTMSIYGLANQLPSEKKTGALRRIKATPFRPWQLILSLAMVYAILTMISASLMVTLASLMFDWDMRGSWLVLGIFCLVSVFTLSGFGMLIAGWAKNENQSTMASQLIAFPLMFLSGVFIPLFVMPDILQTISKFIPLTPVVDGLRYITTEGAGLVEILPQIGMIVAWGLIAYFVAFKVFRWE